MHVLLLTRLCTRVQQYLMFKMTQIGLTHTRAKTHTDTRTQSGEGINTDSLPRSHTQPHKHKHTHSWIADRGGRVYTPPSLRGLA